MSVDNIRNKGKKNILFTNWAKTYACIPELFFTPEGVEELKEILTLAHLENKKVRLVGRGHSPSDIACSTGYLVSLQKFNKVIEVDERLCQIKVEGGITLTELNNVHLPNHGLALSVLGSISDVTVAGAISTGTHGSGMKFGTMSTFVVELEILTSTGEIVFISREKCLETFQAACCALGAYGIILTVILQCERAFNLELNQYPCPLNQVLENLEVHLKSSDHFRFLWFPHTNDTVVSHVSRTNKKPLKRGEWENWCKWFWDYPIGYYTLEFCYWISSFIPRLVPLINRVFYRLLYSKPVHYVERSDRIFNFECLFKQYVNEWAIPVDKTGVVLQELQAWLATNPDFYAHFPVEIRFTQNDDLYISPAYGRSTCYINIIMYRPYNKNISIDKYWTAYEKIMFQNGGRPHWAKAHKLTAKELKDMYPQFGIWCQLRKRMDPTDTFVNGYLERIL